MGQSEIGPHKDDGFEPMLTDWAGISQNSFLQSQYRKVEQHIFGRSMVRRESRRLGSG